MDADGRDDSVKVGNPEAETVGPTDSDGVADLLGEAEKVAHDADAERVA